MGPPGPFRSPFPRAARPAEAAHPRGRTKGRATPAQAPARGLRTRGVAGSAEVVEAGARGHSTGRSRGAGGGAGGVAPLVHQGASAETSGEA